MKSNSLVVACPSCGVKNRVPISRLDDTAKCGRCGAGLPMEILASPVNITDASFAGQVLSSHLPVLVDCWAPWCGPCRAVGPVMDELAMQYKGRLKVAKLNLDENPETGSKYAISSVPTLLVFKNGRMVDRLVGALPKEQIEERIAGIL